MSADAFTKGQIRAAGIVCPSCGVNMADVDESHVLTLTKGRKYEDAPLEAPTAKCDYGRLVNLAGASFEEMQAAANVALLDDFRKNLAGAFDRMLGGQP